MNGYKIVLLKAIFMLYKLPESERVCSGICRLPYYQEKDSGKDIRELLPDVWKLKKSNENPIEI